MVMISQQLSLIVMAALGTAIIVLVTGGARIQAENYAQTELRIANTAFTNDVDNASTVYVRDDTRLTLTSTTFLQDSSGNDVCRVSEWFVAPATDDVRNSLNDDTLMSLRNNISVYPTVDCNVGTPSTQERIAISAMTDDSRFVYTNIAGVPLVFANGIVTSIPDVSTPALVSQARTDLGIDPWYTVEEITREVPRIIELDMTAVFPLSERNEAIIKATTNEAVAELQGNNDDIIDPPGEQTRWVPNPVSSVTVSRSGVEGAFVGGLREGIQIQWSPRPASECSPVQTATYSWIVTNNRTGNRSSGETTGSIAHVRTGLGGDAEIWNGGNYTVQVAVRCNDTDGQSNDRSAQFTLPLPPVTNVVVENAGGDINHRITWDSVSSDPTTEYTVQMSAASPANFNNYVRSTINLIGAAEQGSSGSRTAVAWLYPGMPWGDIGSTSNLQLTENATTLVPGLPQAYQVRASTDDSPNTTGIWTPATYIYNATTPDAPVINSIAPAVFGWDAVVCPTNTNQEYRADASTLVGTLGNPPVDTTDVNGASIQTTRTFGYTTINEGARVYVLADARCSNKFTLDPTNGQTTSALSPWGDDADDLWDRPITAPAAPTIGAVATGSGNGSSASTSWGSVTCAVGTNLTYEQQYTSSSPSGVPTGVVTQTGTSRSINHGEVPGTLYDWRVRAVCSSEATGSLMSTPSTWNTHSYYTSVPAPTSVSVTRSTASTQINTTATAFRAATCVAGTSVGWDNSGWSWSGGSSMSLNYSTAGTRYPDAGARCVGANGQASGYTYDSTNITWFNPAPAQPSGCSVDNIQNVGTREGIRTMSWGCNNTPYATSYTGGLTITWSGSPVVYANLSSGSPSFSRNCLSFDTGIGVGNWSSVQARVTASNSTGSSPTAVFSRATFDSTTSVNCG